MNPDLSRLLKYTKRNETTGCLEWTGAADPKGRGNFKLGGRTIKAPRAAWILQKGPIPDGLLVCHECDNTRCVEIGHLFLGTQADNMIDCVKKRRHRPYGAGKLTEDQVSEIKLRLGLGEKPSALCREFGVSDQLISQIKKGRAWAHVIPTLTWEFPGSFLVNEQKRARN
jgi:hypothetical protein